MADEKVKGLADDLREVAELAAIPHRVDEFLDRALDAVRESIPCCRAAFLELRAGTLRVLRARGAGAEKARSSAGIPLGGGTRLARVLDSRRASVLDEEGGSSPETGALTGMLGPSPEGGRLVVPVVAGERDVGLLLFDASPGTTYSGETIGIASIYGDLVGLGLAAARQAEQLERYRTTLEERNRLLVEEVSAETDACEALERSSSRAMRRIVQMAKQVAITDAPVLIGGETGTGKEILARAIHAWSRRSEKPFIQINCAALPENLIESELFGHRKGAFSGATSDRPGRFRLADGGTLLLDEIGDLPASLQVKLLRVLQEGRFEPVGSDHTVSADVRIIAATNVDLERAIAEGAFREDLYYRLHVFPLVLPPLRDRPEDLPVLVQHVLHRFRRRTGRGPWTVAEKDLGRMRRYDWPGNVRELVNALERARVFSPLGGRLRIETPESDRRGRRRSRSRRWLSLDEHQRRYIEQALEATSGKIYGADGAAKLLGLPPTTLQSRMTRLGVRRPGRGGSSPEED